MPGASLEAAFSATLAEQQAALARSMASQEQGTPLKDQGNAALPKADTTVNAEGTQETILFPLPEDSPAAPNETDASATTVAATPAAPTATTQASTPTAATPVGNTSAVQPPASCHNPKTACPSQQA